MKPRLLKRSFTMIELVVSLGVFSILTLLLMQFFTSAQNAWTTSERRAQLYADSRVVFDLIANAAKAAPRDQIAFSSGTSSASLSCPTVFADGTAGTLTLSWSNSGTDKYCLMQSGTRSGLVLDGVMKFEVQLYDSSFNDAGSNASNASAKFLVVRLQLLSYPDFREYQSVPAANQPDYLTNHAYNFVRMIILP